MKIKSRTKYKSAAILTIKDSPRMTKTGRKQIANWLRRQADLFECDGKLYSRRFTARYLYM